uniref:Uncharacterized protein n=1 Tax=Anguilla anguilla TaxID=7936 RepID=A0A0E9UK17_ANGAN
MGTSNGLINHLSLDMYLLGLLFIKVPHAQPYLGPWLYLLIYHTVCKKSLFSLSIPANNTIQ